MLYPWHVPSRPRDDGGKEKKRGRGGTEGKKRSEEEAAQKKNKGKRPATESPKTKQTGDKNKRRNTRAKDSDLCPKHPHGSHTWGECRSR
jgi:hypothetical protein